MKEPIDLLQFENALWNNGYINIAGIDEAGRGPLAGPVVAACVVLDKEKIPSGINDSKKLSPKKREQLFEAIMGQALSVGIGIVDAKEIDSINILQATLKAMRLAVEQIDTAIDYILIDGKDCIGIHSSEQAVIGGDALSASIAAASIIAKVTRDRLITEQGLLYPDYGFAKHKGYGTKEHIEVLLEVGPCPVHRITFISSIMQRGRYTRE